MSRLITPLDHTINQKVGANLRKRRLKLGFKQFEVAEYLNVSADALSGWELGRVGAPLRVLYVLSQAYSCKIDDFFDMEVDPSATRPTIRRDLGTKRDYDRRRADQRHSDRKMADQQERSHGSESELRVVDTNSSANGGGGGTREAISGSLRAG